jgi:GDP-D-mannose 3', 5'-epimerase
MRILVTGGSGFIGGHLVERLTRNGHEVTSVDIKPPEFRAKPPSFVSADLRYLDECANAFDPYRHGYPWDLVFMLAADMGGIGFITGNHAEVARNNALINLNSLEAVRRFSRGARVVYTSSACVYNTEDQKDADAAVSGLKEGDAWPALPEEGYGLEKLFSEKLCQYYREDYGVDTCVVRLHNVYGPLGAYVGGREKAPAALCRKVAIAALAGHGPIDVWGDGEQTRSFMYVDDCVEGLIRLAWASRVIGEASVSSHGPVNLGSEEYVTINALASKVMGVAGFSCKVRHDFSAPQGVRGRNSDNTLLRKTLAGWEPMTSLDAGLAETYPWIADQIAR